MAARGVDPAELGPVSYLGSHPAALVDRETDVTAVSVSSPRDEDVAQALDLHAGVA